MNEINLENVLSFEAIDTKTHSFNNKDELFHHIANMFYKTGYVNDIDGYVKDLYKREEEGTTYMGNGLVIPHGRSDSVDKAGVSVCRFHPMSYDGEPVEKAEYAVALAIPDKVTSVEYMKLLAKVACSLLDEDVVETVKKEEDVSVIMNVLSNAILKEDE